MRKLTHKELREYPTLIREFMIDRSATVKTMGDLVNIFGECFEKFTEDESNDLRILKYEEDMVNESWDKHILFIEEKGEIQDGIHRGVAYLRCIYNNISPGKLPEIYISEKPTTQWL